MAAPNALLTPPPRAAAIDAGTSAPKVSDVAGYHFYPLVELLRRLSEKKADPLHQLTPEQEAIRFRAHAGLGFPRTDVLALQQDEQGGFHLEIAFVGLHGSQSPLPGYYLDTVAGAAAHDEPGLADFLDLFHHRVITQIHDIWRKYRYYIHFQPGGDDAFSQRIFALMGLMDPALRQTLHLAPGKMLAYAGLLASPGRSPETLSNLVAHCFDLPAVAIQQWTVRWVRILVDEQNRLGAQHRVQGTSPRKRSVLGDNFVLGERIPDRRGKFTLSISQLSRPRFMALLPSGREYRALVTFVAFALREPLAWDLRLVMAPGEDHGMTLGDPQSLLLGWSTFLGNLPDHQREAEIVLNILPLPLDIDRQLTSVPVRLSDGDFESHYRHEHDYMKALATTIASEKPHLARFLGEQGKDAQVERVIEGFALHAAGVRKSLLDAFPHLTEGYLSRVWPFPLRPIPSVAVAQLHQTLTAGTLLQRVHVPAGAEIYAQQGSEAHHFITCHPLVMEPVTVLKRQLSHGVAQSHLTLTLRYEGTSPTWQPAPFTLYLGNDVSVAATLRLWFEQHQSESWVRWPGEEHRLQGDMAVMIPPTPDALIIPRDNDDYWALQHLVEGLTLHHVQDFITVDLSQDLASLPGEGQAFTLTLTFEGLLPLESADIDAAFIPHCVPVINLIPTRQEKLPFIAGQSRYSLPLAAHETLFRVQSVHSRKKSHHQGASDTLAFVPLQQAQRFAADSGTLFYQLEQDIGASGRRRYAVAFSNQQGEPLMRFPHTHFECDYQVAEQHAATVPPDAEWTAGWGMPPGMAVSLLSTPTPPFPALTDSHHQWRLISHLTLSSHFLGTPHTLSQIALDFAWHITDALPQLRGLQHALAGIADITSLPEDRLVKGQLVRGRALTVILAEQQAVSPGEMYRFIGLLRVFFAHTLTRLHSVRVEVIDPHRGEHWHFRPMRGQRPMM